MSSKIPKGRGDEKIRNIMKELREQSIKIGASNIFLVRGDEITEAVKGTWEAFTHYCAVDKPVARDPFSKSNQLWLVGFLGVAGSGEWSVKSAYVTGEKCA